jgi:hypothetical protein
MTHNIYVARIFAQGTAAPYAARGLAAIKPNAPEMKNPAQPREELTHP